MATRSTRGELRSGAGERSPGLLTVTAARERAAKHFPLAVDRVDQPNDRFDVSGRLVFENVVFISLAERFFVYRVAATVPQVLADNDIDSLALAGFKGFV